MRSTVLRTGSYALMHLIVAIGVAYALTRDLQASLAIGLVEPLVQTVAFALHHRFWSPQEGRLPLPLHGGCDHGGLEWRALVMRGPLLTPAVLKTLSYAVMHLVVAVAVAFALTRSWQAAMAIGLVEPLVQTVAFSLHDRFWSRRERALSPARVEHR